MVESRLDFLREAAVEFVSSRAIDVSENWNSVSFRIGARAITVSSSPDEDSFIVLVDSEYEGTLRVKATLVDDMVDDLVHKSLWISEPEYVRGDNDRYPMPPGPAYSLLALAVVVASVFGYNLYGNLLNLKDCMEIAKRLLNDINDAAEVPKLRAWEDDPSFLENMVESYIYLLV